MTIVRGVQNIFKSNLKKSKYRIKNDAFEWLNELVIRNVAYKEENFGNVRFVLNVFENVIQNQTNRIAKLQSVSGDDLTIITIDDVNTLKYW